mgnify:CR=1 FL=1
MKNSPEFPKVNSNGPKAIEQYAQSTRVSGESDHEKSNATPPINLEKALGSIYEDLSDDDKARINYALTTDEKLRSLFASMTSADFGSMLSGLSGDDFEAQAQPYRDLIEGILTEQAGANAQQRNPEVTLNTDEDPENEESDDAQTGERAGVGANALTTKTRIEAWLSERRQKSKAKRAERRREYTQELLDQGIDPVKVREMVNKRERNRTIRNRIIMGVTALAAGGVTWYLFDRFGGSNASGGGADGEWKIPKAGAGQDIISENQLHDYFNMPNPMESANGNNLTGGNEALANMDKAGAVANLENAFRGDTHMTAMWASQLGIPGAPEMPSLDILRNDPNAANVFNVQINDWADTLNNDVRLRADVTNQLIEKVNGGSLGDKITLNPGYMSTGRYNAPEGSQGLIFGAGPGEVFLDTEVWKSDVPAIELVIDGHTYLWEPGCDQLAYQGPVVEQPTWTPQYSAPSAPETSYVTHNPSTPTPSTPETPSTPTTPSEPTPPVDTPSEPTEPQEPTQPYDGKEGRNPGVFEDQGSGPLTEEFEVEQETSDTTGRDIGGGQTEAVHTDTVTNEQGTQQNGSAQNPNVTNESHDTSSNSQSGGGVGQGDTSGGTTSTDNGADR